MPDRRKLEVRTAMPTSRIKKAKARTELVPPKPVPAIVHVPVILKNSSSWGDIASDVLLEIATYLRDDRYALLPLTQVCAYWREVLVECPLNWTQISTKYPRGIFQLWLRRSKSAPIDAEIHDLHPKLLPLLKSNKTSFRSLSCTLNKQNLLTLFGGLTQVSSNLERLELRRRTADRRSPITLRIISGAMPSLKDLSLTSIDLTREIVNLRYLVNLILDHPYPSLTAILDLIASNPRLETIALRVKCVGQTDPRPKGAVMIPRLRTLRFEFYLPLPLFHQFSIPRGASVSFSLWTDAEECILPDSLEHLQNLSEVRNLHVRRAKHGHWMKASGPSGEVKFEDINDPLSELRRLPLESVEKFRYVEVEPSLGTIGKGLGQGWIFEVFNRLRNLQTLVIGSCGLDVMKDIFGLLSPRTDRSRGLPLQHVMLPCPILSTIALEVPRDGGWSDWVVPFLQMLRTRAAAGSRLKKFRIVSRPDIQIPRQGEEKRKQMAKFVPWVEVKYLWYEKDGRMNERRARELFEWRHDEEVFSGDVV